MLITFIILAIIGMTNIIGAILVFPTKKEFTKLMKGTSYYIPSSKLMRLERIILMLSSIGGWFGIMLTTRLVNYKNKVKNTRFHSRLRETKYFAIFLIAILIVIKYLTPT